jgi:hypothetical protein
MSFFEHLFRSRPSTSALSPLQDPVLGTLEWDSDSEGWVADLPSSSGSVRLYIGAGSESLYPGEPLLALMREPFQSYDEHCKRALAYLAQDQRFSEWNVHPETLMPAGIQTFEHYLAGRTYSVVFNAPDDAVWKVNFRDGNPTGSAIDD